MAQLLVQLLAEVLTQLLAQLLVFACSATNSIAVQVVDKINFIICKNRSLNALSTARMFLLSHELNCYSCTWLISVHAVTYLLILVKELKGGQIHS